MRKKLLALLLTVSMTVCMAGCKGGGGSGAGTEGQGKSDSSAVSGETEDFEEAGITYKKATDLTKDDIELTYFHFDQKETVEYLADRFMKIYPNIKVNPVYEPVDSYNDTLQALLSNSETPDVVMYSDADFALNNTVLRDIKDYWDSDPETKEVASTVNDCGLGCFSTNRRYAVPVKFFPGAVFVDMNVLKKLNIDPPERTWKWSDMIDLIKKATKHSESEMDYYGLAYYNRLDSLYGIAAAQTIQGEFGYNGKTFDLGVWAIGEQEFSDLKLANYVAPQKETPEVEEWMGDWEAWAGASGHVAVFSEAFWTYQNTWATEGFKQYNLDIVPYAIPAVNEEDAKKTHHSIATIDFGGVTTTCEYPREAYELLKFMSFGADGWKTRVQLYNDESQVNASGLALKYDVMPAPITTNQEVWDSYIEMYCKGMDDTHVGYWKEYFQSCMQPIPYGWTSIAGYWNYCDQYFNKLDIHTMVDNGDWKAADRTKEATEKANYYHAKAMLDFFGSGGTGYGILSDEEVAEYQQMMKDNAGSDDTGEEGGSSASSEGN